MSESAGSLIGGVLGSIISETVNQIHQNYKLNQKRDCQMMSEEEYDREVDPVKMV